MLAGFDSAVNNFVNDCAYIDLTSINTTSFSNCIVHVNIWSLRNKISELEGILRILDFPKIILITETWLSSNSSLINIDKYSFISSPRHKRGGGVGVYIHDSLHYCIKKLSSDSAIDHVIDYLLIEVHEYKLAICCMYCPQSCKLDDIF